MELKKYKLGEIAEITAGGDAPKNYTKKQTADNSIPIYSNGIDNEGLYGYTNISKINRKAFTVSARGTIGVSFKRNMPYFPIVRLLSVIPKNNNFDLDYLYYASKLFKFKKDGSVQQQLTVPMLTEIEISIPPLESQQKIAAVLSALDDKIALNCRMNAKLEQMAKRLYDHWFVQFDFPNADGKPYKSSGGKMEYNEVLKREIPAGWEVKKLGDGCEIVLGGTPSTANNEFWDNGTISWLNSGEVGIFPIVESEKKITEIAVEKSTTEFLKAGSVTLSITRYLRPSILAIDACINQSVVGIKENDLFKNCFLYPYLQNEIDRLMSLRTGAQQPHINKEIVEDSFINIPPKELMEKYEKKVTPIYLQIINIAKETQKLTVLRDRLLPLLMNGQVEVK